jgi:NADP-dependent 3-hydroxy acid dehydrogenase YdfG
VTINGRSQNSVNQSFARLKADFKPANIFGMPGDVSIPRTHQELWEMAVAAFGKVDIWINNAGMGQPLEMIWDLQEEKVHQLVDINIKGLIFGSQIAVQGMLKQGYGHIYNMEGLGSDGRKMTRLGIYGTTKSAVHYFSNALTAESIDTPVKISTISPGMVMTDLVFDQFDGDLQALDETKKIFNILADKVETVTPWLVDKMLNNHKTGAKIKWLTPLKIFYRFAAAPFRKRDLFS